MSTEWYRVPGAAPDVLLGALRDPGILSTMPPATVDLTLRLARRARLLGRLAWRLDQAGHWRRSRRWSWISCRARSRRARHVRDRRGGSSTVSPGRSMTYATCPSWP